MENIYAALSLALAGSKRFVVFTDNQDELVLEFQAVLSKICQVDANEVGVLDLIEFSNADSYQSILQEMTCSSGEAYRFKQVIVWKNVQFLSEERQEWLMRLLKQIDHYNTHRSTIVNEPVVIDGLTIYKPQLFTIVSILSYQRGVPKINQFLKECFWFSTNCPVADENDACEYVSASEEKSYRDVILKVRAASSNVYLSPEISGYIYSLVIFMRNHRLCSLAPNTTRLSTRAIDAIQDLCVMLVAWLFYDTDRLYVTPEYVKIAIRKVAYWLIDWEQSIFASDDSNYDLDVQKQLELSILTGDWYGSDWKYVKKYIDDNRSLRDDSTPTGYSNAIVEDAIYTVRPPI